MLTNFIRTSKEIIIALILVSILIGIRVLFFDSEYFMYLFWNIFLACIPFLISSSMKFFSDKGNMSRALFVAGIIPWLLFLPNAPYIITDMIHLGRNHNAPILYDTFLLFSAAWAGMLLYWYSLLHIEGIIKRILDAKKTAWVIVVITLLVSFGMYLGRVIRFNSWDVFSDTSSVVTTLARILSDEIHHTAIFLFILPSFIFLYLSYQAWKLRKI